MSIQNPTPRLHPVLLRLHLKQVTCTSFITVDGCGTVPLHAAPMTESLAWQRVEGQQPVDIRVERAMNSLLNKLDGSASFTGSASISASASPPSPPSYQSTFFPLSPPLSPPSPAPSLSLLGKLALSNFAAPPSSPPRTVRSSEAVSDPLPPLPSRQLFGSISPPPVPPLFSRPSTGSPVGPLSSHSRSRVHRSPPRLPSFSPNLESTTHISDTRRPPPSYHPHTFDATPSFAAPHRAVDAKRTLGLRGEGESEWDEQWHISSDTDVRRMLDELRHELRHIANKLAAIKRYTARPQPQQRSAGYSATVAELESESEVGASVPLSPRTRHIVQLLEEADELLQHNKPTQPYQPVLGESRVAGRKADVRWTDALRPRPQTAPSHQFAASTSLNRDASSVQSVTSTHLLRAYDELLDRFRSQVLRIDATLATVD